jgi:hypothetical protein
VLNTATSSVSSDNLTSGFDDDVPIYPWPQVIESTVDENGKENYSLEYPGKFVLRDTYKTNIFDNISNCISTNLKKKYLM